MASAKMKDILEYIHGCPDVYKRQVQLYRDYKQIIYYRHVDLERKKELFSNAYTLLHMINHDEAFELDVIEAMANGTL